MLACKKQERVFLRVFLKFVDKTLLRRFPDDDSIGERCGVAERLSATGGQDVLGQPFDVGGGISDADGGECRDAQVSKRKIANADHSYATWHRDSKICQRREDGKRCLIIGCTHSRRRRVL